MKYRKSLDNKMTVSALGFGAMRLPIIDDQTDKINEEKAIKMIRTAIDNGVNYVDTAYDYHGKQSERLVKKALEDGYREKVFLADKLPMWHIKDENDMERIFNEQLEKLGTDRIDLYMLHALNARYWQLVQDFKIMDWMEKKKEEGKIGLIGFSFHDSYPAFKMIVDGYDNWDFCQIQYNFMDEEYQAGKAGLQYAYKKGINVVIMEPLRGGDVVNNVPDQVKAVYDTAESKRSYAGWALQWLWDQPEVWLVLSGMSKPEEVEENLILADKSDENFSDNDQLVMKNVQAEYGKLQLIGCTGCNYCKSCPQGINIPQQLKLLDEYSMYHNDAKMKFHMQFVKFEERAIHCTSCNHCVELCPQKIDIPAHMKKYAEMYKNFGLPMEKPEVKK